MSPSCPHRQVLAEWNIYNIYGPLNPILGINLVRYTLHTTPYQGQTQTWEFEKNCFKPSQFVLSVDCNILSCLHSHRLVWGSVYVLYHICIHGNVYPLQQIRIFLLELSVVIISSTYACNTSVLEHTEQEFSRICPWQGASTQRSDRSVINVSSAG